MRIMKLLLIGLVFLVSVSLTYAVPEIAYTNFARTAGGGLVLNSTVDVRITIFNSGTQVYQEIHTAAVTNGYGLFTVKLGTGTPVGLDTYDALVAVNSLNVQAETNDGGGYRFVQLSPLLNTALKNEEAAGIVTLNDAYMNGDTIEVLPGAPITLTGTGLIQSDATIAAINANGNKTLTTKEYVDNGIANLADNPFLVYQDASAELPNSKILNGEAGVINFNAATATLSILNDGISEPKLKMANEPLNGYVIKWNGTNMTWVDPTVFTAAPVSGDGTVGNPITLDYVMPFILNGINLDLEYDATLLVHATNGLGINLANPNSWTGKQTFADVDINGGSIDGTVIGGAVPAAGTFTTLVVNTTADIGTDLTVGGDATVAGLTTTNTLDVTLTANVGTDLTVGNDASIGNDLDVVGNTTTNTLDVVANATVGGDLDVTGTTTSALFVGQLDKEIVNGDGVATFMYDNTADATVAFDYNFYNEWFVTQTISPTADEPALIANSTGFFNKTSTTATSFALQGYAQGQAATIPDFPTVAQGLTGIGQYTGAAPSTNMAIGTVGLAYPGVGAIAVGVYGGARENNNIANVGTVGHAYNDAAGLQDMNHGVVGMVSLTPGANAEIGAALSLNLNSGVTGINLGANANDYAGYFIGKVNVTGNLMANSLDVVTVANVGTDLTVGGDATVAGLTTTNALEVITDALIGNDLFVVNDLGVGNDAQVGNNLEVIANTTTNTLEVLTDALVGNDLAVVNDLGVGNNAQIGNNLEVFGNTTTNTLDVTLTANVGTDLTVGGDATVAGLTTTNTLDVTLTANVGTDLTVGGDATVAGLTTTNTLDVTLTANVGTDLTVGNNANIGNDLDVVGNTSTNTLDVTLTAFVGTDLTVGNDANVGNNLIVAANTTTNTLDVTTDATVGGDLTVGGNTTTGGLFIGELEFDIQDGPGIKDFTFNNLGDAIVEVDYDATLKIDGMDLLGLDLDHSNTWTAMQTFGPTTNDEPAVIIDGTSAATNPTLVVVGNGVPGDADFVFEGDFDIIGSIVLSNDLTVGGLTTTNTLDVTLDAAIGNDLDVANNTTTNSLDVINDANVGGNLDVTGHTHSSEFRTTNDYLVIGEALNTAYANVWDNGVAVLEMGRGAGAGSNYGIRLNDNAGAGTRAGIGHNGTAWVAGVGDLTNQNGVMMTWNSNSANEARILVANGNLLAPVFLVDAEGDVFANSYSGELEFDIQDGAGIADFTFNNLGDAIVAVDYNSTLTVDLNDQLGIDLTNPNSWTGAQTFSSVDINGGTIDGTVIGGDVAAAGTFTTATATTFNGGFTDGALLFGDASGNITENAMNLLWDNVNNSLVIDGNIFVGGIVDGTYEVSVNGGDGMEIQGGGSLLINDYIYPSAAGAATEFMALNATADELEWWNYDNTITADLLNKTIGLNQNAPFTFTNIVAFNPASGSAISATSSDPSAPTVTIKHEDPFGVALQLEGAEGQTTALEITTGGVNIGNGQFIVSSNSGVTGTEPNGPSITVNNNGDGVDENGGALEILVGHTAFSYNAYSGYGAGDAIDLSAEPYTVLDVESNGVNAVTLPNGDMAANKPGTIIYVINSGAGTLTLPGTLGNVNTGTSATLVYTAAGWFRLN